VIAVADALETPHPTDQEWANAVLFLNGGRQPTTGTQRAAPDDAQAYPRAPAGTPEAAARALSRQQRRSETREARTAARKASKAVQKEKDAAAKAERTARMRAQYEDQQRARAVSKFVLVVSKGCKQSL